MDFKRTIPIRKTAWLIFSGVLFGLAWLMRIPFPSKLLVYFWELWPMFFTESGLRGQIALGLLGSTVVFLVAAVFLGWILAFLWGLLIRVLRRDHESSP